MIQSENSEKKRAEAVGSRCLVKFSPGNVNKTTGHAAQHTVALVFDLPFTGRRNAENRCLRRTNGRKMVRKLIVLTTSQTISKARFSSVRGGIITPGFVRSFDLLAGI